MSIFPTRVKPGGAVTFHLSVTVPSPQWAHLKAWVVNPAGARSIIFDRVSPYFPVPPRNERDELVEIRAGELYEGTPLLIGAVHLQEESLNAEFFAQHLRRIRDATHHYIPYRLPRNAPLGRYRMEIQYTAEGNTSASGTASSDCFLVESLSLAKVVPRGKGGVAQVRNSSQEPVLANLVEFTGRSHKSRLVTIGPRGVTRVPFSGTAFLSYLSGKENLRLGTAGDPVCLRNPRAVPLPSRDGAVCVVLAGAKRESGYVLDRAAARLWNAADGFQTRSRLRTRSNSRTYAELVKRGLLLEL